MGSSDTHIKNSIADICHRLDRKGFGANHDGNVSVKCGDTIYATPTAMSKADITPDLVIALDLNGEKVAGHGRPFSEIGLHLAAYRARPDMSAVVHAHPPYATARGLVGLPLDRPAIPESVVSIGDEIPVARFAMPGDADGASIVSEMLAISNVFMLPGNGVLSVGTDVLRAYLRIELVEHIAKIDFIATRQGKPMILSGSDVGALLDKRAKAGLAPPVDRRRTRDEGRGTKSGAEMSGGSIELSDEKIQRIIGEEVAKAFHR